MLCEVWFEAGMERAEDLLRVEELSYPNGVLVRDSVGADVGQPARCDCHQVDDAVAEEFELLPTQGRSKRLAWMG